MKPVNHTGLRSMAEFLKIAYVENEEGLIQPSALAPFLNSYITMRTVKKGEDIIRPTDQLSAINLVVRGKAFFIRTSPRGDANMLGVARAPMFIGLLQLLLSDKQFYSQILAAEQCLILDIDCGYFLQCMKEEGEAALIVMRDLSKVIARNHARMERMMFLNSTDGLISYICRKWLEAGEASGKPLYIREQHNVIATDIGVSVRTLYRSINKLKDEGLMTVLKGGVLMFTADQLEEIRQRNEKL